MINETETTTTVWVVNEAGHPTHLAKDAVDEENVQVKPLTLGNVNPFSIDRNFDHLARGIVHYARPTDYLLISGAHIINMQAILLWILHHGVCRILQWDAKNKVYRLADIKRDRIGEILEKAMIRP